MRVGGRCTRGTAGEQPTRRKRAPNHTRNDADVARSGDDHRSCTPGGRGFQLSFTDCTFVDLAQIWYPTGGWWNDKTSSIYNNQSRNTTTNSIHNNKIDSLDVC